MHKQYAAVFAVGLALAFTPYTIDRNAPAASRTELGIHQLEAAPIQLAASSRYRCPKGKRWTGGQSGSCT